MFLLLSDITFGSEIGTDRLTVTATASYLEKGTSGIKGTRVSYLGAKCIMSIGKSFCLLEFVMDLLVVLR